MRRTRPWPLVAAAGCATLIAACGSGAAGTGTGTGITNSRADSSAPLRFANCMRSHGVSNFPDPGSGGGIQVPIGSKQSPTFQAAARACSKYGPRPGGSPPQLSAAQRRKLIALSQCMRAHGVPGFPDPTFPSSGGAMLGGPNANFNRQSPAFEHASVACGLPFK